MKRILCLMLAVCLLLCTLPCATAAEGPTEAEAYEAMIALKSQYPEGTSWGSDKFYLWNGGIYAGGSGCVAFAFMLSDAAFGALPARQIHPVSFADVRVGDILRMNSDTHSVIVLETHEDCVVIAEGSYNDSVHWGRILTVAEVESSDYLMTRYPDDSAGGDDTPSDFIIPPDAVIIDSGSCGEDGLPNVKWTLCADGTLYLTGFGPTQQYAYDFPGWYDSRSSVTKVVVQEGITNIGSRTFSNHTALTEVVLPDSVTEIGPYAFDYCTSLSKLDLPENLEAIESYAFRNCQALQYLEFPSGLKTINISAFTNAALTEAILPDGLTYLGSNTFEDCVNLKKLHIPGSVNNNIQYLCQGCTTLETVTFGEGLAAIGRYCFQDCAALKTVSFPSTISDIGESCFQNAGLTELVLPEGLEELGNYAFQSCTHLETLRIPGSITTFGNYVFSDCESLAEVTVAEGITDLGSGTFEDCSVLDSITLPTSLKRIGAYMFASSGLTWLEIPGGVTEIGTYAFERMDYLQVLTIPSSVTWIGQCAADRCDMLSCIYFDGTQAQYDAIEFQYNSKLDSYYDIHFVDQGSCAHSDTTALAEVRATCESFGVTGGTLCADCGKVMKAPELITELAHNWSEWIALDAYTERRTCSYCHRSETREIEQVEPPHPFTDVAPGAYYEIPVIWALENNITSGMTATTFVPKGECTRGQVVTFLWRAAGCPEPTTTEHPFTDVKKGAFYYEAMLWAVENGITTGVTETTFAPGKACDRGTVVTFLWRAKGEPAPASSEHPFTDVKAGKFYYNAMLWAVENDITSGMTATTFDPSRTCSRGQVVTFLYRTYVN